MNRPDRTYIIAGVLALIAASCGGVADTAADETLPQPTTTEAAPVTSEANTSTTEHTDDAHMDDAHEDDAHMDDSHEDDSAGHEGDDSAVSDVTFEVTVAEFAIEPTSFEVAAGQTVKFLIKNSGLIAHEFRASNEHRIEEHIAAGHEDHGGEGGHHEDGDIYLLVQPGETEEMLLTFPEDMTMYTKIVCLLPGHFEAGMNADLSYESG